MQPQNRPKARVLLADGHFLTAETLSIVLAPHFAVVGVINDGKLVVDEVVRLEPEIVVLDVTMPGLNGLDAARMILARNNGKVAPNTKIVFLSMHANRVIVKDALRAGASAFVVKNCAVSDLILAITTVLGGGSYVSPDIQEESVHEPSEELSKRQITVLRLVAQGCSAKQIGIHLNISKRTAEFHKNSIMEKLKLRTTAQLTRYTIEQGIAA